MTQEERQRHIAAFEAEAEAPRPGWIRLDEPATEIWQKEFAGAIRGEVIKAGTGWRFHAYEVGNEHDVIVQGVSSRRGFAMDGVENELAHFTH